MNFNDHSKLAGQHAFLSASKYHWLNYDDEKLTQVFKTSLAAEQGTLLHDFASRCINLNQRLPKSQKTLNMFVNDAIGFNMASEQILYYSPNCFGTADAIAFRNKKLRIHDLKTGTIIPGHMEQLMIYAALFCLEYGLKPSEFDTELRIYQFNDILVNEPAAADIEDVMRKIVHFDKLIDQIKEQEN